MKPFYRSPSFWVTTLLTLFAVAPLLRPGYFWGAHDARHDVYFIQQYNITWNEGVLFPRWSPDWAFGYGYPFFNIYAPGSTFLGTVFYRLLSLTLEGAVKATLIATVLLSAWSMWLFVRDSRGERAAMVAAVAYVYVPYHLLDVYVRAAMAESLALAVLPLALLGVRRAVLRPGPWSIALAAVAYAAVHLSSNLVALLFTPLLLAYAVVLAVGQARGQESGRHRLRVVVRALLGPMAGMALGLALAAFFVLPALLEARYVNLQQWYGGYYNFHDHFVYLSQLFDPRWGFGISTPGPDDPISYQLGLVPFALAALALWRWFRLGGSHQRHRRLETGFWLLVLGASVWLTTAASSLAWDYVPLVSSAQFPWRYLTIAGMCLAILAPTILPDDAGTPATGQTWLAPLLLAGLLILGSSPYLRIQAEAAPPGGATLAGLMEFQRSANEMTGVTAAATEVPTWSPLADLHVAGQPITTQVNYSLVPQNDTLAVDAREHRVDGELLWVHAGGDGQRVPFYRQWYPGWTATLLDPETGQVRDRFALAQTDTYPPYGLLNVPVPAGDSLLRLSFEDTPVRRVSEWLSLAAVLVLVFLIGWQVRKNRRPAGEQPP